MNDMRSDRDLQDEVFIDAPADRVWAVLTNPDTMRHASPELFAMTRRGRGPYRLGETFVGWNRRGLVVWPTVNTVTVMAPTSELSWYTKTSGATWTYTITEHRDRTGLREQRRIARGVPTFARIFTDALLGGMGNHADELDAHVSQTLRRIKGLAEQPGT